MAHFGKLTPKELPEGISSIALRYSTIGLDDIVIMLDLRLPNFRSDILNNLGMCRVLIAIPVLFWML